MKITKEIKQAIVELLYKIADDSLILGHRNSEWTGLGPIIEEDISFSSMAQDKIGHSLAIYTILQEEFGEPDPDTNAFLRSADKFHCSQFVEYPIGEYDFSLVRHFLFDHADKIRYEMLAKSSFEPISFLANKVVGELKYHELHAVTFITQLGNAGAESRKRLQGALNECYELALGIFEPSPHDQILKKHDIFEGEASLKKKWLKTITPILAAAKLKLPKISSEKKGFGGRKGMHTEYLQQLLDEMSEVLNIDPGTEW